MTKTSYLTPLITPVPNLNGNSAESLVKQLRDVMEALLKTREAFVRAADVVHGRNFQTLKDGELKRIQAANAWGERMNLVRDLEEEILNMALEIQRKATGD